MVDRWSPATKIRLERQLWIAVLLAQRQLGVDVPIDAIEAYEKAVDLVDLDSIEARERVTRHDVKARIEEFSALAGHEHIHKGMTSRDLTENVEQLQIRSSLQPVRDRMVTALARLADLAADYHTTQVITGRSHNCGRPGHDHGQAVRQRRRGAPRRSLTGGRPAGRALSAPRDQGSWSAPSRTSSTCSTATSSRPRPARGGGWPSTWASNQRARQRWVRCLPALAGL